MKGMMTNLHFVQSLHIRLHVFCGFWVIVCGLWDIRQHLSSWCCHLFELYLFSKQLFSQLPSASHLILTIWTWEKQANFCLKSCFACRANFTSKQRFCIPLVEPCQDFLTYPSKKGLSITKQNAVDCRPVINVFNYMELKWTSLIYQISLFTYSIYWLLNSFNVYLFYDFSCHDKCIVL